MASVLVGGVLMVIGLAALLWVDGGLGGVLLVTGALTLIVGPSVVAIHASRWALHAKPRSKRLPIGGITGEEVWFQALLRSPPRSDSRKTPEAADHSPPAADH